MAVEALRRFVLTGATVGGMAPPSDRALTPSEDPQRPESPFFWLKELHEAYEELGIAPHGSIVKKVQHQADFLAAFVRHAGPTLACGIAGVSIHAYDRWRYEDPIFQRCYDYAHGARAESLIFEARRRGVDGVPKTIRNKNGEIIGEEREYSTQLLLKLMQGLDPQGRFWNRPAPASADAQAGWRAAIGKILDKDPEALALLDELADKMVGENQSSPETTTGS